MSAELANVKLVTTLEDYLATRHAVFRQIQRRLRHRIRAGRSAQGASIIEGLDFYIQLPCTTRAPALNSEEPLASGQAQ